MDDDQVEISEADEETQELPPPGKPLVPRISMRNYQPSPEVLNDFTRTALTQLGKQPIR